MSSKTKSDSIHWTHLLFQMRAAYRLLSKSYLCCTLGRRVMQLNTSEVRGELNTEGKQEEDKTSLQKHQVIPDGPSFTEKLETCRVRVRSNSYFRQCQWLSGAWLVTEAVFRGEKRIQTVWGGQQLLGQTCSLRNLLRKALSSGKNKI